MSKTIREIAQLLSSPKTTVKANGELQVIQAVPKVQLVYAFNGTGKTLLSREFKELIAPKIEESERSDYNFSGKKVVYFNAFTEDLFNWDNDLEDDVERKLKIQPNAFTNWILKEQGQDQNIITNFQRHVNDKLTPRFNQEYKIKIKKSEAEETEVVIPAFSEVTFALKRGNENNVENIKISKGEESNFIWSIFFTLLVEIIAVLNVDDPSARETNQFDQLEYVFIDDPVSSLDENHLIQLAVDLASLIKISRSEYLKFIITTHNPLFYNVLYNELNNKKCYLLVRFEDGTFELQEKQGDSNQSFSYHLHLKQILERAIAENKVEKFHFTLLRNLYEKTASFLGYPRWSELLPDNKEAYLNRIIQFTSHSTISNEIVAEPSPQEKQMVRFLMEHLNNNFSFWPKKEREDVRAN